MNSTNKIFDYCRISQATTLQLAKALDGFSEFIYFPSIGWDHSWERQQTLISSFCNAHADKPALVIAPTGLIDHAPWRMATLQKMLTGRLFSIQAAATTKHVRNPVPHNLNYLNLRFGRGTNPMFAELTMALNSQLRSAQKKRGRRLVLASYVNPLVDRFLKTADLSILDLAERRQANPALSQATRSLERSWANRANLLVTDNEATLADYASERSHIGRQTGYLIPQGFTPPTQPPTRVTARVAAYLGNLHDAIDYKYFKKLIQVNSDWTFKLCGQIMSSSAQHLLRLPNVRYQGVIANHQISSFLADAALGLIPYVKTDWTSGVFPTKLFEYLSHYVPVLSTKIPEVAKFAGHKFIQLSDDPIVLAQQTFARAEIDDFLAPHTWDARINTYARAIVGSIE